MKKTGLLLMILLGLTPLARAVTVPQEINYQGKVEVNGIPFQGLGYFKFAIVNTTGTLTLWSNDGATTPTAAIALNVNKGIVNVRLGDTSYPNMTQPITSAVFNQPGHKLRMWFSQDNTIFKRLLPDQPLSSVPYALMAQSIPDNSITGYKLTRESVWPEHEGRGNTVVAYENSYNASGWGLIGTVPAGKTFIITDIYFCNTFEVSVNSFLALQLVKDATTTPIFKGKMIVQSSGVFEPCHISFKAGIPVTEGTQIQARDWYGGISDNWCIIAGYQFTN